MDRFGGWTMEMGTDEMPAPDPLDRVVRGDSDHRVTDHRDTDHRDADHRDAGRGEPDEVVEFATFIRERPVTCRWADGRVTGDPELLDRMSHMAMPEGWTRHPASVAKAISDAVAHPVTIRIVGPHQIDLTDHVQDHPCDDGRDADVLGDYWLG